MKILLSAMSNGKKVWWYCQIPKHDSNIRECFRLNKGFLK